MNSCAANGPKTTRVPRVAAEMKKKVLILCTGNSCRSQMAEGILRHYGGASFEVFSAGTRPSSVHAAAIQVMREIGIDISGQRSKHVDEFSGQTFDYVITVCDHAKESCPLFPGQAARLHWSFPDPPQKKALTPEVLDEFRAVRDLIHQKFKQAAVAGIS